MLPSTKRIFLIFGLLALVVLYGLINPSESAIFPKCPIFKFTGLQCSGCGSQRAVHHLLNFDIGAAIQSNALVVFFLPYIVIGLLFDRTTVWTPRKLVVRKTFYSTKAILVILAVILAFTVLRNVL
ncbi:MAG TPA: DUF2752 domain-containing protein [Bacteroidetes bacterium]|nr:DUF2752 domain-containing protein [Bacteroidota bacterium]